MLFTMNYTNAFSDENSYIYLSLWKEELFLYEKEKMGCSKEISAFIFSRIAVFIIFTDQ